MSFQFKRRENDKQGQGASSSGNGDGIDDLRVDTSARFDAGLGGRAQSGQWQIELAGIPTDPRDEARSTGTAQAAVDLRSNISLSALSVQEEEFPSLPGDSRNSNAVLWAHGVTSAGKRATQSRKESEFPSLPPSKGSTSDLKKAAFASKSNSSSSASSSHSNGGGVLSTIFSSGSVPSSTSATPATSTTIPSYAATPTAEDFPSMASGTKKAAVKASYSADSTFRGAVQENASVSLAVRMHMSREPVITRTATEVLTNSSPAVYPSLSANNKTVTKSASISSTSSVKKPVVAASASMSSWGSALGSAGIAVQPKKKEKKAGIAVAKLPFAKAVSSTSNRQIVDQDFIDESKMIGRVKSSSSLNEKYMAPASIKN